MKNIYKILEKHFQEQSSENEEKLVFQFKKENNREYLMIKQLWHSHNKIRVSDFDSQKAWMEVLARAKHEKSKPFSIYSRFKQVAAVAVIVIVGSLFTYFIAQQLNQVPAMVEVTTLAHETDSILLADGSTVWLNHNSKLFYPKEFKGKTRNVKLEGEAYFVVAKNTQKPFKVTTQHSTITVLGTTFNINTNTQQTIIWLATGKVNIQSNFTETAINLLPNDKAIASKTGLIKSPITNPNYLSWKTGKFVFEDTPLETVINDLNRFYKKPIILLNSHPQQHLTACFDNAKLEDIIKIIELTCKLPIEDNNNTYEIH